jgi:hypothetical protein
MGLETTLLELEEAFWRAAGDRERYEQGLAADALHVFPGFGIVDWESALAGVAEAEPWTEFAIKEPQVVPLGESAAAIVYEARAIRAAGTPYEAAVASLYRRENGSWHLVLHQQTPLQAGDRGAAT